MLAHLPLLPGSAGQRQTAVTAYFTSKQLLLFAFDVRLLCRQARNAVTGYFSCDQLLLVGFCVAELSFLRPPRPLQTSPI